MIKEWKSKKERFFETEPAKKLKEIMDKINVAIVTGMPGTGKSFTVQNVLLSMKAEGYDVIPVRSSSDLVQYFSKDAQQVFYLDDFCGKYYVQKIYIEEWQRNSERLMDIFKNPSTRCILICRLQIFLDSKFVQLKLGKIEVINLSDKHELSVKDKLSVAKKYLNKEILKCVKSNYQTVENCNCFPLLCSLHNTNKENASLYFEKPKAYFEKELTEMSIQVTTKYACIALCVMFNNEVIVDLLSMTNNKRLNIVYEELGIKIPAKKALLSYFDSMVGSFFQKTKTGYKSTHDYMFDIFCVHVSNTMPLCVIKYADSKLLLDRALFESLGKNDEYAIVIPAEYEKDFFPRILKLLYSDRTREVFGSSKMKYEAYRKKIVSYLIGSEFDLNESDEHATPLTAASHAGYADIVNILCNGQVDVNKSDEDGSSPLTAASYEGNVDVINILCDKGAYINQSDENGTTPLTAASCRNHVNVIELLLKKGAAIDKCDGWGITPLTAASDGNIDIVKLLVENGADVNLCDDFGMSSLTVASYKGHADVVELLLRNNNVGINLSDRSGKTPLTAASSEGHLDVVNLLCSKNAIVDLSDGLERTPLTVASSRGHVDVVNLLCSKNANVNGTDWFGRTPLTAASRNGHLDVVNLLCGKHANVDLNESSGESPLTAASSKGHYYVVNLLCSKNANVNGTDWLGRTPLTAASRNGHLDVVNLLCSKHAYVDLTDSSGESPLTAASSEGHVDVVSLLCSKNAIVDRRDGLGRTPLTAASSEGHLDVVQLLYSKNAIVDLRDGLGRTPLTVASSRGQFQVVKFLCNEKANVNLSDGFGRTPLTAASSDCVEDLLRSYGPD